MKRINQRARKTATVRRRTVRPKSSALPKISRKHADSSSTADSQQNYFLSFADFPKLNYPGKQDEFELLSAADSTRIVIKSGLPENQSINRLYCGDNLAILNHLRFDSSISGKVKLVYIDPPYSSNQEYRVGINGRTATVSSSRSDETAYIDNLKGAEFIEFLRKRLILLKDILSEDGSLYLHIDSKTSHYIKVVLDEIFGQRNFRNDITRIKCNPKNFERKGFGNIKDTILFYTKSDSSIWNEPRQDIPQDDILKYFNKVSKDGRRYTTTPLHAPGETINGPTGTVWKGIRPPIGRHWRYSPQILTELDKQGLIEWSNNGNPRKIIYADDALKKGKKTQDIWDYKDSPYPHYPTEKNLSMLEMIIRASSNPGDIVLDCFAGSGTTLCAAAKNSRYWIGIDQSISAIEVARKRLNSIHSTPYSVYNMEKK